MTDAINAFIEEARAVTVMDAVDLLGITRKNGQHVGAKSYAGPCPSCGGRDRFSINPALGAFNCRGCQGKGRDGIALIALARGHDLNSRRGFLEACSEALGGRPIPSQDERESDSERAERLERIARRKAENEKRDAEKAAQQNDFRQREIDRARGIYLHAGDGQGTDGADYLRLRTGYAMDPGVFANLRFVARHTYWHGQDERGLPVDRYSGPALIAPFVTLERRIIGCHQTWIDIAHGPKFRPDLGVDEDGAPLPTKKMRGRKTGGLIPLFGLLTATRWVGGEGIENGLAIAGSEGFRADTFYFAAGDLGNLAGPADPVSRFRHPTVTQTDRRGRVIPVWVPGPVPRQGQDADDAMQVPDHVDELVLLADGDSEPVFTAAAMARAEARMARKGRAITTWWPPEGQDFSKLMAG
ncbi:primase-helicase zinc-binding domain-containing protein [Rhizobium sp. RU36D]|uniref:DUF7146 domain-containing protein n=1 Tax=Rhizobium sp. RU36D TaxID=1907415 RepID=UPI0009D81CDE|nr:primase-helicase zinc-binding domain-containing protein [Rhizobium sp. RU36D]SMD18558.1 Zinc-binding domain of primase-helicase [Rhizobium sp. RU36D]